MSGHPLSIPHNSKTGVLSEKALQGKSTYRATRWQAKALQTHRPAMREDCAELPFLCRSCVRPYTAQIRPHCLVLLLHLREGIGDARGARLAPPPPERPLKGGGRRALARRVGVLFILKLLRCRV